MAEVVVVTRLSYLTLWRAVITRKRRVAFLSWPFQQYRVGHSFIFQQIHWIPCGLFLELEMYTMHWPSQNLLLSRQRPCIRGAGMGLIYSLYDIRTSELCMLQLVKVTLKSLLIFRFSLSFFYFPILTIFDWEARLLLEGQCVTVYLLLDISVIPFPMFLCPWNSCKLIFWWRGLAFTLEMGLFG